MIGVTDIMSSMLLAIPLSLYPMFIVIIIIFIILIIIKLTDDKKLYNIIKWVFIIGATLSYLVVFLRLIITNIILDKQASEMIKNSIYNNQKKLI